MELNILNVYTDIYLYLYQSFDWYQSFDYYMKPKNIDT